MHACLRARVVARLPACFLASCRVQGFRVEGFRDVAPVPRWWQLDSPQGGCTRYLLRFLGDGGGWVGAGVRACGRACLLACLLACVRIYICMCVYISPCTQEFTELPRQEQSKGRDIDCRLMWMPGAQVLLERFCSVGPRRDAGFSGFSDVGF